MKRIALYILAAIGGFALVFAVFSGVAAWLWLTEPEEEPEMPENVVLNVDFSYPIVERVKGISLSLHSLLQEEPEMPLLYLKKAIETAAKDPRVKGMIARIGTVQPNIAHIQEVRAALKKFRENGKFTYVFATNYGGMGNGTKSYYLASAFENIWLQPVGMTGLTNMAIEAPFGKSALAKLGVEGDFIRREEYKSVMENVTRDGFSAPVRENMESLISGLEAQITDGISESRKIDRSKAAKLVAEGPYTASESLNLGLITKIGYADEIQDETKKASGDEPAYMSIFSYYSLSRRLDKTEPKTTIALINGSGMISEGGGSPLSDDYEMNSDEIAGYFEDAAKDEDIKAIIFRVDSPGGSPSASETIRRAVVKAKEAKKPVFVSMGSVAASGGYWIAMNADKIIASPGTITGSIGVIAGKFALSGLWDKLGVKWDGINMDGNAKMWSSNSKFSQKERERINLFVDDTYDSFLKNVSEARKIPMKNMADIAKGRVWTGEQAVKIGLVDGLGGLSDTIAEMKKELKLSPDDKVGIVLYPPPETPVGLIFKILKNLGMRLAAFHGVSSSLAGLESGFAPLLGYMRLHAAAAVLPFEYLGIE